MMIEIAEMTVTGSMLICSPLDRAAGRWSCASPSRVVLRIVLRTRLPHSSGCAPKTSAIGRMLEPRGVAAEEGHAAMRERQQ